MQVSFVRYPSDVEQLLDELTRLGDDRLGIVLKGPYIDEAVTALDNILRRMTSHHYKKNALLRPLHSWQHLPR